jgi:carbonic anhydrase
MVDQRKDLSQFIDAALLPELQLSSSSGEVELVLLTCMDFRYPQRILDTMESKGLKGKYDHLILAGASLGVLLKPEWKMTFLDQLRFAVEKHGAKQVLILDHRDCGAYKEFLGVTPDDPAQELEAHRCKCREAMDVIVQEIPSLAGHVHSLLLPIENVDELGHA